MQGNKLTQSNKFLRTARVATFAFCCALPIVEGGCGAILAEMQEINRLSIGLSSTSSCNSSAAQIGRRFHEGHQSDLFESPLRSALRTHDCTEAAVMALTKT